MKNSSLHIITYKFLFDECDVYYIARSEGNGCNLTSQNKNLQAIGGFDLSCQNHSQRSANAKHKKWQGWHFVTKFWIRKYSKIFSKNCLKSVIISLYVPLLKVMSVYLYVYLFFNSFLILPFITTCLFKPSIP